MSKFDRVPEWMQGHPSLIEAVRLAYAGASEPDMIDVAADPDDTVAMSVGALRALIERIGLLEGYLGAIHTADQQALSAATDAVNFGKRALERLGQ